MAKGPSLADAPPLNIPLHVKYIQQLDEVSLRDRPRNSREQKKDLAYHLTAHLRLNGVYWGLTALSVMGQPEVLDRAAMIDYVMECWDEEAGECAGIVIWGPQLSGGRSCPPRACTKGAAPS